jgi:hypothetical protein
MYDDLQECVLRYEELEPEEREKDVDVIDNGKEFRNPVSELIAEVGAGEGVTPEVVCGLHQMLVDDKKYLMSILAAGFVRVRGEGQIKLGHSKLHLVGRGSKEIVFVPKGATLGEQTILDLAGKRHWDITPPDMCTQFDFGNCHPIALASPKLHTSEQFIEIASAAAMLGRDPGNEIDVSPAFAPVVRCHGCAVISRD